MKKVAVSILLLLFLLPTAASLSEKSQVSQVIVASVERNPDKTTTEKATLYCLQKDIYWCEDGANFMDVIMISAGLEESWAGFLDFTGLDPQPPEKWLE